VSATAYSEFPSSFASSGEDLVLRRLFWGRESGFYVDVGAWHPWRSSNTYGLYLRGWHGINVDARPGSMALFNKMRGRDINLETAVGTEVGPARYHHFAENSSVNSLHPEMATHVLGLTVARSETVCVRRLESILNEYLPASMQVNLLSIDTEGSDLDVLKSNDWELFRPEVVVVEEQDDGPTEYLRFLGYKSVAETPVVLGKVRNRFFVSGTY
jgi:FkbM family methyltransferase